MTLRVKPTTTRPRRRTHWQNEERTQFLVTIGFIVVVVLSLLALAGAVGSDYYNKHLKSVAKVAGTDITVDQVADRAKLISYRINRSRARIREAMASEELDAAAGQAKMQELDTKAQTVTDDALEELIDQTFEAKLASDKGLPAVTSVDVDAAQQKEAALPERRKVQAIFVEPKAATEGDTPTTADTEAALANAEKALADLNANKSFAEVARQYSTDASKDRDGEYGTMTPANASDPEWVKAIFDLPQAGTTEIIKGADGTYRIGRVTEITPGGDDPTFESGLQKDVSLDAYRKNLEHELVSQKLTTAILADAVAGDRDQLRLAEIFIAKPVATPPEEGADPTPSPAPDDGQVKVRHILYSPKDDPQGAADLAADDPAWTEVQTAAQAAVDRLKAILDPTKRETEFAAMAKTESDDTGSGAKGGQLDFSARANYVAEFADAIFDGEHTRGEIIGPVKSQFGYHVIFWQERRAPAADRIAKVDDLLKQSNADFAQIAKDQSEGPTAEGGGLLGWSTKDQLAKEVADAVTALQAGGVTGQVVQDDGIHWYNVLERTQRPLDADQEATLLAVDDTTGRPKAFEDWYGPQKDTAETDGTINREDSTVAPDAAG